MSDKLMIDWQTYDHLIERLALRIHAAQVPFDCIVALARGGVRIGDALSRIFQVPLGIWFTSSYCDEQTQQQLVLGEHIAALDQSTISGRVLLVDDLCDSGATFSRVVPYLQQQAVVTEVKTAVLWMKANSQFSPNFYVEYLAHNPWIVQPFECFDGVSIDDLLKRGHQV
jgi:uncharacterized protein